MITIKKVADKNILTVSISVTYHLLMATLLSDLFITNLSVFVTAGVYIVSYSSANSKGGLLSHTACDLNPTTNLIVQFSIKIKSDC